MGAQKGPKWSPRGNQKGTKKDKKSEAKLRVEKRHLTKLLAGPPEAHIGGRGDLRATQALPRATHRTLSPPNRQTSKPSNNQTNVRGAGGTGRQPLNK